MTTATPSRLPFLDGLRLAAFALLIPYHVGMYYVSWDWHVKSATPHPGLEPFMLLTSPWRLGLLFFVAGAACQGLMARRGTWGVWRDRSRRLLWPLLFGMAVIVVPQAYFEVLTRVPDQLPGDGGYLDFWAAYLQGGRYCRGQDCMSVPTWNHLWFLPYLWLYACMGALLAPRLARWFGAARPRWLANPWAWCLLPLLPLAAARVGLLSAFPSTHDLVGDLYNHAQYGWLFALGWAVRTPAGSAFWAHALRARWALLGVALLAWGATVAYFQTYDVAPPPEGLRMAMRVVWAGMSWWAIAAACGWAQRAFQRESPLLRAWSAAVFCLYVLHQSVIVLLAMALKPVGLPWGLEAVLLIVLTTSICALAYALLRHVPVLRVLVGIEPPRGPSQSAVAPAGAARGLRASAAPTPRPPRGRARWP